MWNYILFFGGNHYEYIDCNGNTKKIKPGTAHLLEHYVFENTVEGNLLDNLKKYNILNCNGGTNTDNTSYFFNTVINFYECLETFLREIYNISFILRKNLIRQKWLFIVRLEMIKIMKKIK